MLRPLFVMAIGFTLLFLTLHMMAMRNEIWRRRVAMMKKLAARNADRSRMKRERTETQGEAVQ